jgi:hypothetical protein
MKTENSLLGKIEVAGRGALVQVARLARRRTRTMIMPSSDGNGAFVSVVLGKRFHFIIVVGEQRSVDPVGYRV